MEDAKSYVLSQRETCKSITLHRDARGGRFAQLIRKGLIRRRERVSLTYEEFEYIKRVLGLSRMNSASR